MSRSRSNIARHDPPAESVEDQQQHGRKPTARPSVAWITLNAMSVVTTTDGRLASMPSCCATRMSLDRAEIAMPTQIDQPARSGVKSSWARRSGPRRSADATAGLREQLDAGEEEGVDRVRDRERRDEGRQRLAQQELLATDRRREHRLERALLTLADHRVGGDHCRHDRRDAQHVQQRMPRAGARSPTTRAGRRSTISGWMMKISGMTAIATTMEPLRRYSRSSLRKMARTRRPAHAHLRLASCPRRSARGRRPRASGATR